MNSADYERFTALIQTTAKVYGKELDNAQVQLYWDALEDRPFADVERRLGNHARKGKFFPRPRDLRPVEIDNERIESNPEGDARFAAAVAENSRNWDLAIREEGDAAKLRLACALWSRYDCEADQSSTILAGKREWLKGRMADLLRGLPPETALSDQHLWSGVLAVFGGAGIKRLEQRCKETGVYGTRPLLGMGFIPAQPQQKVAA